MTKQPEVRPDVQKAFVEYDRRVIQNNVKLGCLIGVVLMPVGVVLDYYTYPHNVIPFLKLRLLCSLLIGVFWFIVSTPFGRSHPRGLGVTLAMFPSFFIALMIWIENGASSPYYAGLNLVLLVIGFVLYWTLSESLLAVSLVMVMYLAACLLNNHPLTPEIIKEHLVGNLYFLVLTGVIVVTGSYAHSRWRFREFVTRYELDVRTKELEEAICKLREAEAQLVHQEKMASLGVMSAGIIHEINNPLNFAATGLFTLRKKAKHIASEQKAAYEEVLTDIEEGIDRVKTIVSDLRMFTHPDTESVDDVDVSEVVTSTLRFLASELKENVQVEQLLTPGLTVRANKNKLIHVLTNLVQNSVDALRRKSSNGELAAIRIESRVASDRVELLVRDNGPGIAPENQPKIFDPFFTTKEVGEGMGLGLSICYRLMQEFGGDLKVDSQPGQYCQFSLIFPVRKTNGHPA